MCANKRDISILLEIWQTSGLSQGVYCRQHKLNAKTFTNGLCAYREEQVNFKVPTMISVEIKPSLSSTGSLWLRWPGGHALEFQLDVTTMVGGIALATLADRLTYGIYTMVAPSAYD